MAPKLIETLATFSQKKVKLVGPISITRALNARAYICLTITCIIFFSLAFCVETCCIGRWTIFFTAENIGAKWALNGQGAVLNTEGSIDGLNLFMRVDIN